LSNFLKLIVSLAIEMKRTTKIFLLAALLPVIAMGQLKSDTDKLIFSPKSSFPENESIISFFDSDRLTMNHVFSVQMMNFGRQSYSVGSYTNLMSYIINDNLRLRTSISFLQPGNNAFTNLLGANRNQLFYNALLDYKPTNNTLLQFGISNIPRYYNLNRSLYSLGY
jgi:hypothetical protein